MKVEVHTTYDQKNSFLLTLWTSVKSIVFIENILIPLFENMLSLFINYSIIYAEKVLP